MGRAWLAAPRRSAYSRAVKCIASMGSRTACSLSSLIIYAAGKLQQESDIRVAAWLFPKPQNGSCRILEGTVNRKRLLFDVFGSKIEKSKERSWRFYI